MTQLDSKAISLRRRGSGPPLILLHCLGVDHHFWDFASELEHDFTLVSYDLPGHGRSPIPARSYSIEDLSAQLAELLARHNITRAHVAGISLGGLIAQHFAATRPETVDHLILIDTTPRYTDELRAMWAERATAARSAGVKALVESLLKIWFTSQSVADDTEAVRYVRKTLQQSSDEGYALACEALATADLRAVIPNIIAPTLVSTYRAFSTRQAGSQATPKAPDLFGSARPGTHPSSNAQSRHSPSCTSSCSAKRVQPSRCRLKKSSVSFSARSASGLL
jgi:pimeloyl-ACP methyl ester carboxylesterase